MNDKKYYLTKEKLEELKKELEYLQTEGRRQVSEQLQKAKEYGDLSENAEYSQAKEEQAKLEARISELDNMIRNAIIIQQNPKVNTVQIGSTVFLKKDGQIYHYTIVGANEADPKNNKISNESPIGKALLGKKVGDEVIVEVPSGKIKYKITKIQ
jgi:transcription elongation factor GreA